MPWWTYSLAGETRIKAENDITADQECKSRGHSSPAWEYGDDFMKARRSESGESGGAGILFREHRWTKSWRSEKSGCQNGEGAGAEGAGRRAEIGGTSNLGIKAPRGTLVGHLLPGGWDGASGSFFHAGQEPAWLTV